MREGRQEQETRARPGEEADPVGKPGRPRVDLRHLLLSPAHAQDRRRDRAFATAAARAGVRIGGWFRGAVGEEAAHGQVFVWLPVFMGLGGAFALGRPLDIALSAMLAPFALFGLLALGAHRRGSIWSTPLLLAAAFSAGMLCAKAEIARTATTIIDGEVVTHLTGTVEAREEDDKGDWRYTIRVTATARPAIRRPPNRVRLLARSRHQPIPLGATITGLARLSPPSGPALPGGYDFAFNSFFSGVGAIGFFYGPPERVPSLKAKADENAAFLDVGAVREAISARIRRVLPGETGALAAALIVGDRGGIPDATVDALRNAGLAHILSISGLHMTLVAGTFFYVLRLLLSLFPRLVQGLAVKKIAAAGALATSFAYLVISGASVPAERAWIMFAIVMLAVILDRAALTMRNIALAALVVIALDPASAVGPSFQMSFAATAALIAAYGVLSRWRARRPKQEAHGRVVTFLLFASGIIFTSLVAGSATDLFSAYHFHRITTLGFLGNLLAMPLIDFLVMPMGLLAVFAMPYGLEAWPLQVMGLGLDGVIAAAYRVSALGGILDTGQIATAAAFVMGSGLVLLVLMRSSLRIVGVPVALAGLAMAAAPHPRPDILVSEDGRLAAVVARGGLAPDSSRPPSFVFDQWQNALAMPPVVKPIVIGRNGRKTGKHHGKGRAPPLSPADRKQMAAALASLPSDRFACVTKGWCGTRVRGATLVTVYDAAYLGLACDLADIVVTRARVRMTACRSGARLFTARTLNRTGSLEIFVEPPSDMRRRSAAIADAAESIAKPGDAAVSAPAPQDAADPDAPGTGPEPAAAAAPADAGAATLSAAPPDTASREPPFPSPPPAPRRRPKLRIVSSLGGVIRPWTIHRYYDWHTRRFDFTSVEDASFSDSGG
ncbi:MAG: ComEC/Rec2 family competence protein [Pararhizobium sp.]